MNALALLGVRGLASRMSFVATPSFLFMMLLVVFVVFTFARSVILERQAKETALKTVKS